MGRGKWLIGCCTVILMGLLALLCVIEDPVTDEQAAPGLQIQVQSAGRTEQMRLWKNPEGAYYVFVPGYAELEDIVLISAGENEKIGDIALDHRISCENFEMEKSYAFTYAAGNRLYGSTLTFLRSGGVASLYIDVASGSMDYIHMDKNNRETGSLRLYGADGSTYYTADLTEIKGRGNTSWGAEKKPYNLTLEQETDLLGLGAAQNWVLLSEGYNILNIRDKIVYDFADKAELAWSPDCEWVDLYLNGEYAGLYLLSERNEIHEERIDIAQNGSFVVSQEYEERLKEQKYPYIITQSGQALRIRYGETDISELQQKWQTAENAILAEDGMDPVSGIHWRELIDLDSWSKKYLIEEVFGNLDAGSLSQYYYMDGSEPQGKIYAGPVWDYDFAMGGENVWLRPYTDYFTMNRARVNEDVYTPWFHALYRQQEFQDYTKEVYARDILPLLQELIETGIAEYWAEIEASARTDGIRWDNNWEEISREPDYIMNFLLSREVFLTDLWVNESEYHTIQADPGRYGLYGCFAVKDGAFLPELPAAEELGGLGWYDRDTDKPYDIDAPVYSSASIYVKKPETNIPMIHFAPLVGAVVILAVLIGLSSYRDKKDRRENHDTAKAG